MQCTKATTYMIPYIQPLQTISPVGGKTTSGASGDFIRVMSVSEAYQDDHVPEGARPNRWQSLHVVCKYRDHHKPVYPLRRLATATERGHRAKMRFTKSFWDCLETVATS